MKAHRILLLPLPALLLALAGCELTEVTAAEGEDVLVVEAVLRADHPQQRVLLHHTLQGRTVRGEPGARVAVRTAGGGEVLFREAGPTACISAGPGVRPGRDSLDVQPTCYVSPREAGSWVRPGERYELEVRPRGGGRLRGSTRVPGGFGLLRLPGASRDPDGELSCTLPPGTPLELVWSRAAGSWAYVTEMEVYGLQSALAGRGIESIPDPLQLLGVSVSQSDTTLLVPTEVGVFDRFTYDQELLRAIRDGFPAGVDVRILVAAADRNFVNSVRGGAFNPSGTVQVSSIVGDGVGVFGSLVPRLLRIRVRSGEAASPCL